MKLLLDTHVLLWWLEDDARLGESAREAIRRIPHFTCFSDASLWELAIKSRTGKMRADLAQVEAGAEQSGFTRLPIKASHFYRLKALPDHHGDPFDHLLIAQAIAEDATLVTIDEAIMRYPVPTMRCR